MTAKLTVLADLSRLELELPDEYFEYLESIAKAITAKNTAAQQLIYQDGLSSNKEN